VPHFGQVWACTRRKGSSDGRFAATAAADMLGGDAQRERAGRGRGDDVQGMRDQIGTWTVAFQVVNSGCG
jgi:hypothetical protein